MVAVGEDEHQSQVLEVTGQFCRESPRLGEVRVLISPQHLQVTDMDDHRVPITGSAGQVLRHPAGVAVPVPCDEDLLGHFDFQLSEGVLHSRHVYGRAILCNLS